MKTLKLVVITALSIFALSACDFEERISWSPDGKRMAVLADKLRMSDSSGAISSPLLEQPLLLQWLPDSHHALVAYRHTVKHKAGRNTKASEVSTDFVQLFDFSGKTEETKATPGNIVFKSPLAIDDLRLSPGGKYLAIAQPDNDSHKISVVAVAGGPVKVITRGASRPEWSRDGHSIYFLREIRHQDSGYVTFIPVSTISRLPVTDSAGNLLPGNPGRFDLAQVAAGLTSLSRVRVLSDDSILFCSTPVKLPACGVRFGLEDRALFRYRAKGDKAGTLEQIHIEGPPLANALDTFEPNQDGSKVCIFGDKNAVRVIDLSTGKVTLLERPAPESENFTSSFGFAPRWRNSHELCYPVKYAEKINGHDGDVILQKVSSDDAAERQVLSKNWPADIGFLKKESVKKEGGK